MLRQLTIRDFVIVDRLELAFGDGFGALTGETGAGKSILIDALALALGERADAGVVRQGCDKAEVVASFDIAALPEVAAWLKDHDLDGDDELLLRRVVDAGGRSRAYINGSPATVQQLREIGESLVDIHGQHAHQSLLRGDAQRQLFDDHAGLSGLAREVGAAWRSWREAEQALRAAADGAEALQREREQLEWQLRDLDAHLPAPAECAERPFEFRRFKTQAFEHLFGFFLHILPAQQMKAVGGFVEALYKFRIRIAFVVGAFAKFSRIFFHQVMLVQGLVESSHGFLQHT